MALSMNYTNKKVKQWDCNDCLDWAQETASLCVSTGWPNLQAFQNLTGKDILRYSSADFKEIVGPEFGDIFYDSLRAIMYQQKGLKQEHYVEKPVSPYYHQHSTDFYSNEDPHLNTLMPPNPFSAQNISYPNFTLAGNYMYTSSNDQTCPTRMDPLMVPGEHNFGFPDAGIDSYQQVDRMTPSNLFEDGSYEAANHLDPFSFDSTDSHSLEMGLPLDYAGPETPLPEDLVSVCPMAPPEVSAGPSSGFGSLEQSPEQALEKISTGKRGKRLRHPKSWEYLLRLANNPAFNPSLIKWEDKEKGIFKLVDKDLIAKYWGTRTEKHKDTPLSYENFARVLRFHYKSGHLRAVSEKHLVYQFGDEALKSLPEPGQ